MLWQYQSYICCQGNCLCKKSHTPIRSLCNMDSAYCCMIWAAWQLWPLFCRKTSQEAHCCAGAPLFAVGRVLSAGPAGASTPLTFSAHYDNHWEFTTHELNFVLKSSGAEAAEL